MTRDNDNPNECISIEIAKKVLTINHLDANQLVYEMLVMKDDETRLYND